MVPPFEQTHQARWGTCPMTNGVSHLQAAPGLTAVRLKGCEVEGEWRVYLKPCPPLMIGLKPYLGGFQNPKMDGENNGKPY